MSPSIHTNKTKRRSPRVVSSAARFLRTSRQSVTNILKEKDGALNIVARLCNVLVALETKALEVYSLAQKTGDARLFIESAEIEADAARCRALGKIFLAEAKTSI